MKNNIVRSILLTEEKNMLVSYLYCMFHYSEGSQCESSSWFPIWAHYKTSLCLDIIFSITL